MEVDRDQKASATLAYNFLMDGRGGDVVTPVAELTQTPGLKITRCSMIEAKAKGSCPYRQSLFGGTSFWSA